MYVVIDTEFNRIVIRNTRFMGHDARNAAYQVDTMGLTEATNFAAGLNEDVKENRFAVFGLELV